jgi:hypothetical protein
MWNFDLDLDNGNFNMGRQIKEFKVDCIML